MLTGVSPRELLVFTVRVWLTLAGMLAVFLVFVGALRRGQRHITSLGPRSLAKPIVGQSARIDVAGAPITVIGIE